MQQLAHRDWHIVNRQEELLESGRRWEMVEHKNCQQWETATISLMSEVDGIDSGYLLGSIVSNLLRKCSSDVWRAALFFHHR